MKLFNKLTAPSPQMKLRLCVLTGIVLAMLLGALLIEWSQTAWSALPFWWKVGIYVALGVVTYCWTMNRRTPDKTALAPDIYKR
jgi:hypothetical protein